MDPFCQQEKVVDRDLVFKQRRLLFGFTIALIIYHVAHVRLKDELSLWGATLIVERPFLLVWGIWIAWVWAFWRYWQYPSLFSATQPSDLEIQDRQFRALILANKVIRDLVRAGNYESRGVPKDSNIEVQGALIHDAKNGHHFPNLTG